MNFDVIPAGECVGELADGTVCRASTGDGEPRTLMEGLAGRRCYCDGCYAVQFGDTDHDTTKAREGSNDG